jgi:hypothetical protein
MSEPIPGASNPSITGGQAETGRAGGAVSAVAQGAAALMVVWATVRHLPALLRASVGPPGTGPSADTGLNPLAERRPSLSPPTRSVKRRG